MSKKKFFILPIMAMSLLLPACSDDENTGGVSVDEYNNLVKDFNALTSATVDTDDAIVRVNESLLEIDRYLGKMRENDIKGREWMESEQCYKANELYREEISRDLNVAISLINVLSQSLMPEVFSNMQEGINRYTAETQEIAYNKFERAKKRVQPGLKNAKAFLYHVVERYRLDYNENCSVSEATPVTEFVEKSSPVPVVTSEEVIMTSDIGEREIISREEMREKYRGYYSEDAYTHFTSIADASGGFIGFSPKPEMFSGTVSIVMEAIMEKAAENTDIAIVLDTTSSMTDDIQNVKINLEALIRDLKPKAKDMGLRLALVLYRDEHDSYITKIGHSFTSNLDSLNRAVQEIEVDGGGDTSEAVVDALDTALKKLEWRTSASKSVILIGDAPGHMNAKTSRQTTESILQEYREFNTGIIVFPILVSK